MKGSKKVHYHGLQELHAFLSEAKLDKIASKLDSSVSIDCPSWDQTKRALFAGYPEGSADINFKAQILTDMIGESGADLNIQFDVTGDFLDIGRFNAGDPECIASVIYEPKPKKDLTLIINTSVLHNIPAYVIRNRGAAIVALIDELSKDFLLTVSFQNNGDDLYWRFDLDMENGYSRDLCAFFCSHAGVLRRIIFATREYYNFSNSSKVRDIDRDDMPAGCVYFPKLDDDNSHWFDDLRSAKRYIEQVISRLIQNKESVKK